MAPKANQKNRKRKVLVADDSITIQKLVNVTLAGTEFEVITAFDGFDTRNKVRRMKPDLILLDAKLREISGIRICAEIRKDKDLKPTRIVMMRASATPEEREQMAKAGPDAYLEKPFDSKALWAVLQSLSDGFEGAQPTERAHSKPATVDSEEITINTSKTPPSSPPGPFSSYRAVDQSVALDAKTRLETVAAEIWGGSAVVEDTHPERVQAEFADVQKTSPGLSAEPAAVAVDFIPPPVFQDEAPEFNTGEVTNRIRYDDLAREEIRHWLDKHLPVLAERLLKDEIAKFLQSKS